MSSINTRCIRAVTLALVVIFAAVAAAAQTPNAWGYTTGYGNVYGSFGLAATMQSMYNVAKSKSLKASSSAAAGTRTQSSPQTRTAAAIPAVRKNGIFRLDPSVDTSKAFADALGETPDQKALIRKIYESTKVEYEKQAAAKGWSNNIAGGLTFFTLAAVTVHQDCDEPSDEAVANFYDIVNASLEDIPELASVSNKDKQNYNNMLIGIGGILLAGQAEGKQTRDEATITNYRKLAAVLINMVLKTEPDKLLIENGRIVLR